MIKILIPISLATALLDYSGWIHQLDVVLKPAMAILSLPPAAALPILVGILTGTYGCIAAMAVLPLSVDHMTIITVFVLMFLPFGIHPVWLCVPRLAAAILAVYCVDLSFWLRKTFKAS